MLAGDMPSYKLTYFPIKGIAEVSRQLLVLSGQPFEDYQCAFDEWATIKPTAPFGQVPFLEVDGQQIPQSFAIARYLAREFGYAGATPFGAAWVDAIADQWKDYFTEIKPFLSVANGFLKDGDRDQLRKEVGEPVRDKHFAILEKAAKDNCSSGRFVGSSLTWVDLLVADHMFVLEQHEPGFFDTFPAVCKVRDTARSEPRLQEYLAKRPVTYF